jgi:FlaA1/EpsC-like NDP-sugar epimerase
MASVLPEAAGRISMLDMGVPIKIVDLAKNLIRLSGLHDVQINFTGMRPGEKLHEELMSDVEETVPTEVAKIRVVQTDEQEASLLKVGLGQLAAAVAMGDSNDTINMICAMVPECVSPLRERARCRVEPEEVELPQIERPQIERPRKIARRELEESGIFGSIGAA